MQANTPLIRGLVQIRVRISRFTHYPNNLLLPYAKKRLVSKQAFIRLTHHNEILLLPVHAAENHTSQTTLIENVPLTPHAFRYTLGFMNPFIR